MDGETKALIDDRFASLKELVAQRFDFQDEKLERIEAQTTKTNGRVNVLESVIAEVRQAVKTLNRAVFRGRGDGDTRSVTVWDVRLVLRTLAITAAVLSMVLSALLWFGVIESPAQRAAAQQERPR